MVEEYDIAALAFLITMELLS